MLIFLHGLESSGSGTKGSYFAERYPHMLRPDFTGNLAERLAKLEKIAGADEEVLFVGSSYGGVMATIFAFKYPRRVRRLVLLAPALNFPDFVLPADARIQVETHLVIGSNDQVTPPDEVVPVARQVFTDLRLSVVDDDHLLRKTFPGLDWPSLLSADREIK